MFAAPSPWKYVLPHGAFVGQSSGSPAFGVLVKDCWLGTNGFGLASENSEGLQVIGCTVATNAHHGIRFYGSTLKALIEGCVVTGNGHHPPEGQVGYGIAIDELSDDIVINGNFIGPSFRFTTHQAAGIEIGAATSAYLVVMGNILRGDSKSIETGGVDPIPANWLGVNPASNLNLRNPSP